jgi:hypothetical protein
VIAPQEPKSILDILPDDDLSRQAPCRVQDLDRRSGSIDRCTGRSGGGWKGDGIWEGDWTDERHGDHSEEGEEE